MLAGQIYGQPLIRRQVIVFIPKWYTTYMRSAACATIKTYPTQIDLVVETEYIAFKYASKKDIYPANWWLHYGKICTTNNADSSLNIDGLASNIRHQSKFYKDKKKKLFDKTILKGGWSVELETYDMRKPCSLSADSMDFVCLWDEPPTRVSTKHNYPGLPHKDSFTLLSRNKILFSRPPQNLCPPAVLTPDLPMIGYRVPKNWQTTDLYQSTTVPFVVSLFWFPFWYNPQKMVKTEKGLEFLVPMFPHLQANKKRRK